MEHSSRKAIASAVRGRIQHNLKMLSVSRFKMNNVSPPLARIKHLQFVYINIFVVILEWALVHKYGIDTRTGILFVR